MKRLVLLLALLAGSAEAKKAAKPLAPIVDVDGCSPPPQRLGGRPSPSVKIGDITVTGGLDKEVVRRYLRRNLPKLTYCYEKRLLAKPEVAGSLTLTWTIGVSGESTSAQAAGLGDDEVEGCAAQVVKTIVFPKPDDGVAVDATVTLRLNRPTEVDDRTYVAKTLPAALRKQLDGVKGCWAERAAADPGAAVSLAVAFDVASEGKLVSPSFVEGEGDLQTCVAAALDGLELPAPPDAGPTSVVCGLTMAPPGKEWSLDAARDAGALVVRVAKETATLDGKAWPLAASFDDTGAKTIDNALAERSADATLPLLILEVEKDAPAEAVMRVANYGDEVRLARRQGKAWVGVPMHLVRTTAVEPVAQAEVAAARISVVLGEEEAKGIGRPGDRKRLEKGLKAIRARSIAPHSLVVSITEGAPASALLALLDAAHAVGFVHFAFPGLGHGYGGGGR